MRDGPGGPTSAREIFERATPAPAPTAAPSEPVPPIRRFDCDGATWEARIRGESAYGTGPRGRAPLVSILFAPAETPDAPVSEAIVPRGRFFGYYDEELATLLRSARPLDTIERTRASGRRDRRSD